MRLLFAALFVLGLGLGATGCAVTPRPVYYSPAYGYYGADYGYGYAYAPGYYGYGYAPNYYGHYYHPYYGGYGGPVYRPGVVSAAPSVYGAPVAPVYGHPVASPMYAHPMYSAPRVGVPVGGGWHGGPHR